MTTSNIRILAVGPLPPPPSGATVSFQVFCDEVIHNRDNIQMDIVDTSPKRVKENTSIASFGNVSKAVNTIRTYLQRLPGADSVIIFGSNGFLMSLTPILVILAKMAGKPCYIRSFGGSLDQFADKLMPILRNLLLFGFRWSDGLIVETRLLHDYFQPILKEKVHYVPGYRPLKLETAPPAHLAEPTVATEPLRLIFIGWVRAEKGVLVLLDALKKLSVKNQTLVHCDIYGPVHPTAEEQFEREIDTIPSATYGGVLEPDQVIPTLGTYDAMIFPTMYQGEGHPGVVIEAMAAGIPVITTEFRSIPEVVEHRENGLLVEPDNPKALHQAILTILRDRQLLWQMARRNWDARTLYEARNVVPQILQPLLDGLAEHEVSAHESGKEAASLDEASTIH